MTGNNAETQSALSAKRRSRDSWLPRNASSWCWIAEDLVFQLLKTLQTRTARPVLAKKAVELTCSHETAQAAHYTKTLHAHMRNAISPGQGATKRECRHAFMEAARDALESRPRIRR
ncbi:hypothetical protein [Streptomyces rapamycinicus]|uniref:hypothetical protein n=1 Tax=Streptomyces rapamycinicus TaxID=1226757 RepID=UPI0032D9008F